MENIFAISTSRYRINVSDSTLGAATELEFFGGRKGNDYLNEIRKEKTRVRRSKKKEKERKKWSVVVTEVVDKPTEEETSESFHPSEKEDVGGDESFRMEDDQDSAFESDGYKGDSDCEGSVGVARRRAGQSSQVSITAFLPPQHRLWRWADTGRKLSPKSRRVYHNSLVRGGADTETIAVGDCAVFLSTGRPDRPYIGRIHSMWQTGAGNMRVQVMWFYHPAEVEGTVLGGGSLEDIRAENALFSSGHSDENDVQTISHKCVVSSDNMVGGREAEAEVYSLVGEYDPIVGTVTLLHPGPRSDQ